MLLPLISFSLLLPFCQTTFELAEAAHPSTEKTMLDGTSGNQVAAAHPSMSGRAGWASWFDGCSARSWKSCPGRQESGIGHICCKKLIQVPAQFPLLLMFKWCGFQIIPWWNLGDQGAHLRLCSNGGLPQLNAGLLHGCVTWGSRSISATYGTSHCT